jgi:hypothetical protein
MAEPSKFFSDRRSSPPVQREWLPKVSGFGEFSSKGSKRCFPGARMQWVAPVSAGGAAGRATSHNFARQDAPNRPEIQRSRNGNARFLRLSSGRFSGSPEFHRALDESGLGALPRCLERPPGLQTPYEHALRGPETQDSFH